MRHKNDILWKVILEEVFDDLLRFISSDAEQVYDMDRGFEYMDKELAEMNPEPEEKSDTRFADKLVKVFHRDGAEEWVLLHIEIVRLVSRLFNCSFPARGQSKLSFCRQ